MSPELTTFIFEIINFVALMLLLRWLAYKPLQRAIRARRASLAEREAKTAAALAEAEARQRELDHGLSELRAAAEAVRAKAIEEGASERARILEQARADGAAERARARTMVEFERQAALAWVKETAIEQGTVVAGRLLLDLVPDEAQSILIDRLLAALARIADDDETLTDGRGIDVELEVPHAPERALVERVRAALEKALGRTFEISVREDPDLIAGGVLRVGSHVLDASIGGQLAALRERARELLGEAADV